MNLRWKEICFVCYQGNKKIKCPNRTTNAQLTNLINEKLYNYDKNGIDVDNVVVSYDIYDDTNSELIVTDADRLFDYLPPFGDLYDQMFHTVGQAYSVAEEAYEEALKTGYWNGPGFYDTYF